MAHATLVNINRCTGCWTCSLACKQAHDLGLDDYRLFVRTIGGGQIDTPGGTWPNLYMKWMPLFTQSCASCVGDAHSEGLPPCVYNCSMQALSYGDESDPTSDVSLAMEALKDKGYRIYQLPDWEGTRSDVYYAEKNV